MKRLLALLLALLCLTSCASMLEREATYTASHVENPPAGGDTGYRVNTYLGLCSALQSYVEEGMDEGNLRFPATYPGNLTVDLEKAKRYLMEEEPLGCYALNDITFHISRIVAYYEVTVAFDYRVSPAEYMSMETVYSTAALDERVKPALENFGGSFTVVLSLLDPADYDTVESSLRRVYGADPTLALGEPELKVTCYPENAQRAVVEVQVTYPESATALRLRQRSLMRGAESLAAETEFDAAAVYDALAERCVCDPEGGNTAAHALVDGAASSEGMVRAFALVCDLKEIPNGGPEEGEEGWSCTAETQEGPVAFTFMPEAAPEGRTSLDPGV